jgi:hypothetical protein
MKSKMSLTPPGNYSGHTFRYYEGLLLGSLPIEDSFVMSDPLYRSRLENGWPNVRKIMQSSNDIESFLSGQYDLIRQELTFIKNTIDSLLYELELSVS